MKRDIDCLEREREVLVSAVLRELDPSGGHFLAGFG